MAALDVDLDLMADDLHLLFRELNYPIAATSNSIRAALPNFLNHIQEMTAPGSTPSLVASTSPPNTWTFPIPETREGSTTPAAGSSDNTQHRKR